MDYRFAVLILLFTDLSTSTKVLRIVNLKGKCPGKKLPVNMKNIQVRPAGRISYIYGDVVVDKTLDNGLRLVVSMYRCRSREDLNSCENYHKVNVKNFCGVLHSKMAPWTPLFDIIKPKFVCPIQKGVYKINNGTLDGAGLGLDFLEDYFWRVRSEIFDEKNGELLHCSITETQRLEM